MLLKHLRTPPKNRRLWRAYVFKKKDLHAKKSQKVMIYVKYASKEILKQFSKSKILNMAWKPDISTET